METIAGMLYTVRDALEQAGLRDDISAQADKKNYAERLSRALATVFANRLRRDFDGIIPDEDGSKQESPARTSKGVKKLDVNYSKPELGLGLGISIKTLNFPDGKTKRYTKNYTRIDNELRAEAKDYHQRQPFAVMVAVIFLPMDSCFDSGRNGVSSFGGAVKSFRHRAGRIDPTQEQELFERVFIVLYEPEGSNFGNVMCFDVTRPPPKRGAPKEFLTFEQLVDEIRATYDARNNPPFVWADE